MLVLVKADSVAGRMVGGLDILGSDIGRSLAHMSTQFHTLATIELINQTRMCTTFESEHVRFVKLRARSTTTRLYLEEVKIYRQHTHGQSCSCPGTDDCGRCH